MIKFLVALLISVPTAAVADMTATFTHKPTGAEMVLEIAENGDWRGGYQVTDKNNDFYYLTKNGEPYIVSRTHGALNAKRLRDDAKLYMELARRRGTPIDLANIKQKYSAYEFIFVGRRTVLGRETALWRSCPRSIQCTEGFEIELSSDESLRLLGTTLRDAYSYEFSPLMGIFGPAQPGNLEQTLATGSMVRYGSLELTEVSFRPIDPDRLALPTKIDTFEDMISRLNRADRK
ncbi:hypothetical protein QFZ27_001644 [Inquilinus ginsengisoli]|uniref:hypothetical protein n=1 Tax=Inquilinus ginsengisoli TaxID=363840 RepID=UPI003D1E0D20